MPNKVDKVRSAINKMISEAPAASTDISLKDKRGPFNYRSKSNAKEFFAVWLKLSKATKEETILVADLAAECAKVQVERHIPNVGLTTDCIYVENNKGKSAYQNQLPKAETINKYLNDTKSTGLLTRLTEDAAKNDVSPNVIKQFHSHAISNIKACKDPELKTTPKSTIGVNEDWLKEQLGLL